MPSKLLLVKGIAGLGNRMLCALTGILYARLSGRKLLVDWRDPTYSSDGSNVFHCFFRCSLCDPADAIKDSDSVSPSLWQGHLDAFATNMRKPYRNNTEFWEKTSIDLTRLDYPEEIAVMWTYSEKVDLLRAHFKGAFREFSHTSTKAILSKLLREDLILHPAIQKRVDQFKTDHFIKKTVGVHVRYTDYRTRLWAILKRLSTLLQVEPELQIFLSTDNLQIANLFRKSYPKVISTPHWYPIPGLRLHQDDGMARTENGIDALLDLYLLAECEYLIIDTSSSFSRIAKLLTKTKDQHVFDVKQRGKGSARVRKLSWYVMFKLGFFFWGLGTMQKFIKAQKCFERW